MCLVQIRLKVLDGEGVGSDLDIFHYECQKRALHSRAIESDLFLLHQAPFPSVFHLTVLV